MINGNYGKELILDLHDCDITKFNRKSLDEYFKKICKEIKMVQCERYFWDDIGVPVEEQQTSAHTKGTSAVQFILTSSIVIHTLELMNAAYINIFSCKDFDAKLAEKLTCKWFNSSSCKSTIVERV
jgi:S-adenosylmethionine/arginine decarboxylase-like enzyme